MDTSKSGRLVVGLDLLLEQASCNADLPSFKCGRLDKHPFGFKIPMGGAADGDKVPFEMVFIGLPDTLDSIDCLARLVAWRMGYGRGVLIRDRPSFLRILTSTYAFSSEEKYIYYEFGMGKHLYITGGLARYEPQDSPLVQMLCLLSYVYRVPVFKNKISWFGIQQQREQLVEDLKQSWHAEYFRREERRDKLKAYRRFKSGDELTWNPDLRDDMPEWYAPGGPRLVAAEVETIPTTCSCGLGEHAPLFLHRFNQCNLRLILEGAHDQRVTVNWGKVSHTLSGRYFDTDTI